MTSWLWHGWEGDPDGGRGLVPDGSELEEKGVQYEWKCVNGSEGRARDHMRQEKE